MQVPNLVAMNADAFRSWAGQVDWYNDFEDTDGVVQKELEEDNYSEIGVLDLFTAVSDTDPNWLKSFEEYYKANCQIVDFKITGTGTAYEIAFKLKQIAMELESGDHIPSMDENGECEWEDSILMTNISEADDTQIDDHFNTVLTP